MNEAMMRRGQDRIRTGRLAATLLCMLAVSSAAQERPAGPAAAGEEPVRYTVEIIVFAYEDTSSAGNELFAPPAPLEETTGEPLADARSGGTPGEGPVFDDRTPREPVTGVALPAGPLEEPPARARVEVERLEPEAHRLQGAWRKLRQLDAYRPILHAAWTQTTHDKSASPALPLRTVSDPPPGLDGSISLYQSRFLHLDVDLTLDASGQVDGDARRSATDRLVGSERTDSVDEGEFDSEERSGTQLPPVRYRITEDRIMRDGDVRYFDHPRFGMLATVRRVEDEPPDDASGDAGDAL